MSTPHWIEMRDAADWTAPGLTGWKLPVQGYPNRCPPWPPDAFRNSPGGAMRTSVQDDASWAEICREIDVESGAATLDDIVPFLLRREAAGFTNGGVYFSLDNWPQVRSRLVHQHISPARVRLRVADWTGVPHFFDLGDGYTSWAHQFENVPALGIDRNAVFGAADFDRS